MKKDIHPSLLLLIIATLSTCAQLERVNISFRLQSGRKRYIEKGGPLSPLLSNIVLNELDKELERRGHPFVRYADDSLIFCKSRRGAERVCEGLTKFIEKKLHLKVNLDKTEVGNVCGMKYLGHTFYKTGEG